MIGHQCRFRLQAARAHRQVPRQTHTGAQLAHFIPLRTGAQRGRRTLLVIAVHAHIGITRGHPWLNHYRLRRLEAVAADHAGGQHVAVVAALGRGTGDVALALVVVMPVAEAAIDKPVLQGPVTVQRQRVAFDVGLVAQVRMDVGVEVAVGHAQGGGVVDPTVHTHRHAAAVGRVAVGAAATVLVHVAAQALHPHAAALLAFTLLGEAVEDRAVDHGLPGQGHVQRTAVDVRLELVADLRQLRGRAGVGQGLEDLVVIAEATEHVVLEGIDRRGRSSAGAHTGEFFLDLPVGLDRHHGLDRLRISRIAEHIEQRRSTVHGQAVVLHAGGLQQGVLRAVVGAGEVAGVGADGQLRGVGEGGVAVDRQVSRGRYHAVGQVHVDAGAVGDVEVAGEGGALCGEVQRARIDRDRRDDARPGEVCLAGDIDCVEVEQVADDGAAGPVQRRQVGGVHGNP